MKLCHAPVIQKLSAAHCIAEMRLPAVGSVNIRHRRRNAAFGHHGMRFAQQRFANDTYFCTLG